MVANLEDISLSGACVQIDNQIPLNTAVCITYPRGELSGMVRYFHFREIGYYIGIEFEPGIRWSQQSYKPRHMLDPRRLVKRVLKRVARQDAASGPVQ